MAPCPYGIQKWGFMHGCRFSNIFISGFFASAGIDMGQAAEACTFDTVRVAISGGAIPWKLPTAGTEAGRDPFTVINCQNFDGAIPFSSRCVQPTTWGMTTVFSDSVDPVWTGSASNVGKPIKGGGTHTVLGRWDGRQWVIAG
jgi:hypothetical protein